ncbi:hypothetical protein P8452_44918 [Trifolium repens]|nr:hypothetical protein P8452_44918 [Trifolium repens]
MPILVNFGLAFSLSFAGFFCSRLRIRTIKPSPNSPTSGLEILLLTLFQSESQLEVVYGISSGLKQIR